MKRWNLRKISKQPLNNDFFGIFIPDLFLKRVDEDSDWCLFNGDQVGNLDQMYDDAYEERYLQLCNQKLQTRTIKARELMKVLVDSLLENGAPYIVWHDHVQRYNTQRHLGGSSTLNLCAEICSQANRTAWSSCTST